jgi:hypothetical protein
MTDAPADTRLEAAFFDLDKTVNAKAAMAAYLRPFSEAGMISKWLLVRAGEPLPLQTFGADDERMRKFRERAAAARGVGPGPGQRSCGTTSRVIEPLVYEEALDLIREHRGQAAGVHRVGVTHRGGQPARRLPLGRIPRHPGQATTRPLHG